MVAELSVGRKSYRVSDGEDIGSENTCMSSIKQ